MKCEIDILTDRKRRRAIKSILSQYGVEIKEWFVEFGDDKSILSFEIEKEEKDLLKEVFRILREESHSSRIILPNGKRINPFKEGFDRFYQLVCEYIVKE